MNEISSNGQSGWKLAIALCLLMVSAYVSVTLPISAKGIPFTAQSLVVFYVAAMLRPQWAGTVILAYLVLGACGLPIFADGSSGFDKLSGSSGGFLYGFLFSGLAISWAVANLRSRSLLQLAIIMLSGTLILFIFGLGHLSFKFGWAKALEYGLYPFWKMALVKAFLASLLVFLSKPKLFR